MNPEICFSTRMLFQTLASELNASMAMADELSREFDSLMKECSSNTETGSTISIEKPEKSHLSERDKDTSGSLSPPLVPTPVAIEPSPHSQNLEASDSKSSTPPPVFSHASSPDSHQTDSPHPAVSRPFPDCPLTPQNTSSSTRAAQGTMGRMSPRRDSRISPHLFGQSPSSSLPRNFGSWSPAALSSGSEVGMWRENSPAEWSEPDSDVVYGRRPQHAYEKPERLRPFRSGNTWGKSRQDSPPHVFSKDSQTHQLKLPNASLPRNVRLHAVHSDHSSSSSSSSSSSMPPSPYNTLAAISRICAAPISSSRAHWHHPVPLSIIMQAQNPRWALATTRHPRAMGLEMAPPIPQQHVPQLTASEKRQPIIGQGTERHDMIAMIATSSERQMEKEEGNPISFPQPQIPTRLPVVAPEAPGCAELLLLRSEIPRALKKRETFNQPLPLVHRKQFQQMICKLYDKKDLHHKGEPGSESSSSSEGEECPKICAANPSIPVQVTLQHKRVQSILRRPSRERKGSGRRARLSPQVLLLDGALEGDLDTVQRAVKEMSDPNQPNEEGVTALHNAICGGHSTIVDFLVQVGANVSAPDSHGWTPLHCAASCNDRSMCEYLVRSGAAVLSVTEGDGATAVQKCDPFAVGFEECEGFLREVEGAMGVDNGGALYALWGYPAQAPDELSFREGDTVTIKKKQEGAEWWWASLDGREGFVPSNYFSLFPKVQPKSLLDQNQKSH
ncbi:hypothetical protein AAFF_G00370410 [Aldrovandia affinis]|uniref:SH3 domain-containing protein n=1 Tax=Aldrovandia affinis TaxID=143900 RepID=A0AAD7WM60_9TELE|nr:hypothetical protein AAFF_G00370410 [Aldrovandia affinis]